MVATGLGGGEVECSIYEIRSNITIELFRLLSSSYGLVTRLTPEPPLDLLPSSLFFSIFFPTSLQAKQIGVCQESAGALKK